MKPLLRHALVLIAIMLLGFSPFLVSMLAFAFAGANGCTLNEANVHPCVVWGHDYGGLLYPMGMTFWMTFFTMPSAMLAAGIYLGLVLFRRK